MKKFVLGLFVGLTIAISSTSFAESALQKIEAYINPTLPITLDGKQLEIHNPSINYNGTVYVPLRDLATNFGKDVKWNESTQTVELSSQNIVTNAGGNTMSTDYTNPTIYSNFGDDKQYANLREIALNVMDKGYSFVSSESEPTKGLYLRYNNEPDGDTTKTRILIDNIEISAFDGESYIELGYYNSIILPLLN